MAVEDKTRMLIIHAAALVAFMYAFLFSRLGLAQSSRPCISYAPMSVMDEERQQHLNRIYNSTDTECVDMLRMRRPPFFQLCNVLRERLLLRDSVHSTVEEQVAMFIHIVGHNQCYRVVHQTFRRSIETVHRYFREVLYAIGELRQEVISVGGLIRQSARGDPSSRFIQGSQDQELNDNTRRRRVYT